MHHELAARGEDVRRTAGREDRVGILDMIDLHAMPQDPVGVADVIRLVEDDRAGIAEPAEAQERAEGRDEQRPEPAPERTATDGGREPVSQLGCLIIVLVSQRHVFVCPHRMSS